MGLDCTSRVIRRGHVGRMLCPGDYASRTELLEIIHVSTRRIGSGNDGLVHLWSGARCSVGKGTRGRQNKSYETRRPQEIGLLTINTRLSSLTIDRSSEWL